LISDQLWDLTGDHLNDRFSIANYRLIVHQISHPVDGRILADQSSGIFRIWQRGTWRARRARAYNGGLGAEPQAGSRSRAPGQWSGGQSPPEAETLCFWTFNV